MTELSWSVAGLTHCGCVRADNQDNFYISDDGGLIVVADGMGGAEGGATASRIVVDTLKEFWPPSDGGLTETKTARTWLENIILLANEGVMAAAGASQNAKSMGTTVVAAMQGPNNQLLLAHAGDSRAYLLRNGEIKALTNDHSLVMEMFLKGQLTMEQCRNSPWKNLITRCVGHDPELQIEHSQIEILPNDLILLASDGLTGVFNDEQLIQMIGTSQDADFICRKLIEETVEAGAPDNVTVIAKLYSAVPHESQNTTSAQTLSS